MLNTKTINKTKLYTFLFLKRIYDKIIQGNKYPINQIIKFTPF